MEREAEIITETGKVDAVNAAARVTKMLQILSGSVYDKNGVAHTVHHDRYALVMQLVHEREHSVVAFNWRHEREALCALAEKMDLSYAVIDGTIPNKARAEIVANYQAGMYRVIFCHPQSAAHGLTLTKGTATIWCTPTNRPELLKQFNQRIYRAGQTERTETIYIAARNTKEAQVYDRLSGQLTRQADLLAIFAEQTQQEAA